MHLVGIDCRFAGSYGGLGTYTRSLVRALLTRNDPWRYILFVSSDSEPWVAEFALNERVSIRVTPYKPYSFSEQWHMPIAIRESLCDLFFAPHFNVPYLTTTPFLCVIHDMILHAFPNSAGFFKRFAYRAILARSVAKARHIIAISESTKSDILTSYPAAVSKLTVAYPGVSATFKRADKAQIARVREQYGLPPRFLLYVGNCKQHKNVSLLLQAFIAARIPDMKLVMISSGKECDRLRLPATAVRLSSVDDADMPALYSAAVGCVTASLAEGFGLPSLESLACGTPVLATDIPVHREVLGSHALLVPATEDALAKGMQELMRNGAHGESDREWASRFSWETSAAVIAATLEKGLS